MVAKYKRILLKLSGEILGGVHGAGFDYQIIQKIVENIVVVHNLKVEVGIVVGGGNIFRGASSSGGRIGRVTGDHMGMMATIMNSLCLQEMLEQAGKKTRVMSAIDIHAIAESYIKRRADRHLEKGRIVIFAAGTGNPYFTTDTAAVLRASEINADIVIKGTKIDGVYDKDPLQFTSAQKYDNLSYSTVLEKELKVMDTTAIAFCKDTHLPILVININESDSLYKAVCGEKIGSFISDQK